MIGFSVALTGIIALLAMTSLEVRKIDRQLAEMNGFFPLTTRQAMAERDDAPDPATKRPT
jgi:hypothetical protein